MDIEIVLPSGKFATIRPLTGIDWIVAKGIEDKTKGELGFIFITLCVKIEGNELSYSDLLGMDLRDVFCLHKEVGKLIGGPILNTPESKSLTPPTPPQSGTS